MKSVRDTFFKYQPNIFYKYLIIAIVFITLFFFNQPLFAQKTEVDWEIEKSTHFILHYQGFVRSHARDFLQKAESHYETITKKLGFRQFNFWTWDDRCKIYLYSSAQDYYNNTGQPHWSGASVDVVSREIFSYISSEDFALRSLPHEIGHLIFREFIGHQISLPLWIDEGVACLVEDLGKGLRIKFAKQLIEDNLFIPLEKLTDITADTLSTPNIFYSEAASVIEFLLEKYGRAKFVEYCRAIRDKEPWDKSLLYIYSFKSFGRMNKEWLEFLAK